MAVYLSAYQHQRGDGHLPVLAIELWDLILSMVQHEIPTLDIRSASKPIIVGARELERTISHRRSILRPT